MVIKGCLSFRAKRGICFPPAPPPPSRSPTQKPLATSARGLSTLLANLFLRYLARRFRPLPLLMPPVVKRLISQLFLHLSILIHLNGPEITLSW
jgi:hypothetical protein